MPVQPTYPGVYVEEIPSGVRTITGVATSITAFLGRTARGPANQAVVITSFADFERRFGGLQVGYPLSYAVRDFYLNSGSQAIIVRLFNPFFVSQAQRADALDAAEDVATAATGADAAAAATAARAAAADPANAGEPRRSAANAAATAAETAAALPGATPESVKGAAAAVGGAYRNSLVSVGELTLEAASPGSWGNDLRAVVDRQVSADVAARYGLTPADLFNLTVIDSRTGAQERFVNLSLKESPRRVDRVLWADSSLLRWSGDFPPDPLPNLPADADPKKRFWDPLSEKEQAAEKADKDLAAADKALAEAKKTGDAAQITAAQAAYDAAKTALDTANKAVLDAQAAVAAADSLPLEVPSYLGSQADKTGLYALEDADLFNLLCIPPDDRNASVDPSVYQAALAYCVERRAMLIVDSPAEWTSDKAGAVQKAIDGLDDLGLSGVEARNAVLYFPRVLQADPLRANQIDEFVPCGIIAGAMARTDVQRGVWKAPAGIDVAVGGVQGLSIPLTDNENGRLNPLGINCLRSFPIVGRVIWGARTLRGADLLADEYKYVPVRRLALFIEESLFRGLQWVVFEPNDEPLWAQIRLNAGAFMNNLFRQGAFQGTTPAQAYFVKCDRETTTQNDINLGIVNIIVGFAPLKPAEFVIIKLQQMAGQVQS